MHTRAQTRIGGHLVAESLRALGAEVVFGLPGVHALPLWEGAHAAGLSVLGLRQELNAAFAADGYARASCRPAPLFVSTGPGAFMTLGALHESAMAFVPVVVISSQIERAAIGRGRGELHEAPDQAASFAPLVKWHARADTLETIPEVLAEAWRRASTAPPGPVYVEVPADVLRSDAGAIDVGNLDGSPPPPTTPDEETLDRAAALLAAAERPLVVAGGGAVRAGAGAAVLELAERLGAPIATTYTGKGAVSEHHPLAAGSAWDDAAHRELVAESDVVLVVGSWLGYELRESFDGFGGMLVRVDAAAERLRVGPESLGLIGDARATLGALLRRVAVPERRRGEERVSRLRGRIARTLAAPTNATAAELLAVVEQHIGGNVAATWDSTILAYAACWYLRASEPVDFLYPAGSSTLGYAWPAALGAALALPDSPVLAVVGDGGFQYGLAELATARQHGLDVTLLVVDDGGYGILRAYQDEAGFSHVGVDLEHPDFARLLAAYGIPVRTSTLGELDEALGWSLRIRGPAAVVLETTLTLPVPGR